MRTGSFISSRKKSENLQTSSQRRATLGHSDGISPPVSHFAYDDEKTNVSGSSILGTSSNASSAFSSSFSNLFTIGQSSYQDAGGGILSHPDLKEIYYVGIIDILQKYNSKKKIAHIAKSLRYSKDALSTVGPTHYATRFKDFITKVFSNSRWSAEPSSNGSSKSTYPELNQKETAVHSTDSDSASQSSARSSNADET